MRKAEPVREEIRERALQVAESAKVALAAEADARHHMARATELLIQREYARARERLRAAIAAVDRAEAAVAEINAIAVDTPGLVDQVAAVIEGGSP